MHAAVLCKQWPGAPLAWMAAAIMLYIMRTVVACQCRISCTAPVSGTPAATVADCQQRAHRGLLAQAIRSVASVICSWRAVGTCWPSADAPAMRTGGQWSTASIKSGVTLREERQQDVRHEALPRVDLLHDLERQLDADQVVCACASTATLSTSPCGMFWGQLPWQPLGCCKVGACTPCCDGLTRVACRYASVSLCDVPKEKAR